MNVYKLLNRLGLVKSIIGCKTQIPHELLEDAKFNAEEYIKSQMCKGIAKELMETRKDVLFSHEKINFTHRYYCELFVFSKTELEELINHIQNR